MATVLKVREGRYRAEKGQITDAYGREIIFIRDTPPSYHGAGTGRRFASILTSSMGATAAVVGSATTLRNRSHDLLRNNPWAWNGVESFVANCIGTGIKPQSQVKDQGFVEAAHQLWTDWVDEADSESLTDFYGLQTLCTRALVESGEAFVRIRLRRLEDGLSVPMQLQVLEPDHVPLDKTENLANGNTIRAGIEYNLIGQRVAYWMYREHPGEGFVGQVVDAGTAVRVPAESVLHIFKPTRPGQIRGEPWLARALLRLKEIDSYDDAELARKATASLFTGFIRQPVEGVPSILPTDQIANSLGQSTATLEPGTMQVLFPGEDIEFATPSDVGPNYLSFVQHMLRSASAAIGVTYEQLTGDLSGVNFSSIRAGLNEMQRRLEQFIYQIVVYQLCRAVWNRWLQEAIFTGALTAPGYSQNPRPWRRARWVHQGWRYVNPQQEVQAKILEMLSGLLPWSDAQNERGEDPEAIARRIAADNALFDRLGLVLSSDARQTLKPKTATTP